MVNQMTDVTNVITRHFESVLSNGPDSAGRQNPRWRRHALSSAAAFRYLLAVVAIVFCQLASAQQETTSDAKAEPTEVVSDVQFAGISSRDARTELLTWMAQAGAESAAVDEVTRAWADDEALDRLIGEELLDQLIWSFAQIDRATRQLLEQSHGADLPQELVYDGIRNEPFYRHQVTYFRARWLVQHRYYDEALPLLEELDPDEVVDPAGLLFYRAVSQAELFKRSDALDSLTLLLNNTLNVPTRFEILAEMLQQQLAAQQEDGMEQVSRLMKDVERRLDLGRSGGDTQSQEKAVIAALDKLLEDMEQQNQQQKGGGAGSGQQQNQGGAQAANESRIKGAPADGEADRKELTEKGNWGMLDQQAEAKTRELIRQKFPSNFLDQIGLYTRKLAEKKK